jgi:hypothetical protein
MACNETGMPRPLGVYELTISRTVNIIRELHPGKDIDH